jgi:hypothetical protein
LPLRNPPLWPLKDWQENIAFKGFHLNDLVRAMQRALSASAAHFRFDLTNKLIFTTLFHRKSKFLAPPPHLLATKPPEHEEKQE